MKIREMRGEGIPLIGKLTVRPGDGLVAVTGGSRELRRSFIELLAVATGLSEGRSEDVEKESGAGARSETAPTIGTRIEIGGQDRWILSPGDFGEGSGVQTLPAFPGEVLLSRGDILLVWTGGGLDDPVELLTRSARTVAASQGLGRVEEASARLHRERLAEGAGIPATGGPGRGGDVSEEALRRLETELAEIDAGVRLLDDLPQRLLRQERTLEELRADAAEASGELEVAAMEWLRERQDAETHLRTYRDQARELRSRLQEVESGGPETRCPVCGQRLEDHAGKVLSWFQEEWESLVQDGKWWRRRREQLELKPESLQELEGRALRLHAAIERNAEEAERLRASLGDLEELLQRRRELLSRTGTPSPADEDGEPSVRMKDEDPPARMQSGGEVGGSAALLRLFGRLRDRLLEDARDRLLERASFLLNRMSGGRFLGMGERDGRLVPLEDGDPVRHSSEEDHAAATVALRLALAEVMIREEGLPLASLIIGLPFDRMSDDFRLRSLTLFRALLDGIPQILLVTMPKTVELAPESFDRILEFHDEPEGRGLAMRARPGGVGSVRVEAS